MKHFRSGNPPSIYPILVLALLGILSASGLGLALVVLTQPLPRSVPVGYTSIPTKAPLAQAWRVPMFTCAIGNATAFPVARVGDRVAFLTCKHCIKSPPPYTITFLNGETAPLYGLVINPDLDVVLLWADARVDPLELRHTAPEFGETVYVMGYPDGTATITQGFVGMLEDGEYRMSAQVYYGSSGGPVFDANGKVIGIAASIYGPAGHRVPHLAGMVAVVDFQGWLAESLLKTPK